MNFLAAMHELRKGQPDWEKASRGMRKVGLQLLLLTAIVCIGAFFSRDEQGAVGLLTTGGLVCVAVLLAVLFLVSSYGLRERKPWAKRVAQTSVVVSVLTISLGFLLTFSGYLSDNPALPGDRFSSGPGLMFLMAFPLLVFAQFIVPGFFGFRYLGRLPDEQIALGLGVTDSNDSARAALPPEDGSCPRDQDSAPSSTDLNRDFHFSGWTLVRIFLTIFCAEILVCLLAGPSIILFNHATIGFAPEGTELFSPGSYQPIANDRAPASYGLVKVESSNGGSHITECYYGWGGLISRVDYRAGKPVANRSTSSIFFIWAFFGILGVITGWFATLKREFLLYGLSLFFSAFIIGMVFTMISQVFGLE